MNSIQVLALLFVGLLVYTGVVLFFKWLGLPLIGSFLVVYLAGVFLMVGMQRRARECAELQRTDYQPLERGHTPGAYAQRSSIDYSRTTVVVAGAAARRPVT